MAEEAAGGAGREGEVSLLTAVSGTHILPPHSSWGLQDRAAEECEQQANSCCSGGVRRGEEGQEHPVSCSPSSSPLLPTGHLLRNRPVSAAPAPGFRPPQVEPSWGGALAASAPLPTQKERDLESVE